jgi:hypothetical protein
MSTTRRSVEDRIELLQGTLDLLILRTLSIGPAHVPCNCQDYRAQLGHVLQVEQGSLYPSFPPSYQEGMDFGKKARRKTIDAWRVEYDVEKELKALSTCGLPHSDWVAKTLRSASPQIP